MEENLKKIEEDIQETLDKVGRKSDKVHLIAVTKTVDVETIKKSIDLGIVNIGENRVQELEKK